MTNGITDSLLGSVTLDTLDILCYTNHALIKGKIRGITTDFHGYGYMSMKDSPSLMDYELASEGILTVFPFYSPWAWANDVTISFIDRLITLLSIRHSLPPDIPLAISGESMGGLTGLVYAAKSRFTPVCCAADCPVCDLPHINSRRPDIHRALVSAFGHYTIPFDKAIESSSPIHIIGEMPQIPYLITAGGRDDEVAYTEHAERYVPMMRSAGHNIEYIFSPESAHTALPESIMKKYREFIINEITR